MDFTREPIIESVITPKEGCKLVIRSSKGVGQEEFFVDAVEIVSFGGTFFLRSLEKPKAFLVPATDYEVLEVRETRMVLKNVGLDRSIKIGGGREGTPQRKAPVKEAPKKEEAAQEAEPEVEPKAEPKRRERRRNYRKRRGRETREVAGEARDGEAEEERIKLSPPEEGTLDLEQEGIGKPIKPTSSLLSSLLPPPPTLISESIERYRGNELFKNVFIPKEEQRQEIADDVELENTFHDFANDSAVELEAPNEEERKFFTFDDEFDDAPSYQPAVDETEEVEETIEEYKEEV